ncbi:MAG: hypothetical protein IKN57_13365 [Parasporobacterium sp.]|nr:hypothetical protein [Parasporobacterium sp.]
MTGLGMPIPQGFTVTTEACTDYYNNGKAISDEIKSRVEFKQHNLLKDPYPDKCNMIVCRNVLIYFTEDTKAEVYDKFNDSLVDKGILFIGSTEQIMNHKAHGYERRNSFYYQKNKG